MNQHRDLRVASSPGSAHVFISLGEIPMRLCGSTALGIGVPSPKLYQNYATDSPLGLVPAIVPTTPSVEFRAYTLLDEVLKSVLPHFLVVHPLVMHLELGLNP